MDLDSTKKFFLVRAVEEADRAGEVIGDESRGLVEADGSGDQAVVARSERLYAQLQDEHPHQIHTAMAAVGSHT